MLVPNALRTNAFRVLRLSANATLSEIHKAAASVRRAATLGLAGTTATDIPGLGEVSRTEADIRTAVGRLANPALRVSDRLLWFHQPPRPENPGASALATESIASPPERAAWSHDESLRGLFTALEAGLDDSGIAIWIQALRTWHKTVSDDDYWTLALTLEEQGGFEPAALLSDLDALRDDAVRLAADPLIVAGRDALARSDTSTVGRILTAVKRLADTGPWADAARDDIASPAVESFQALCRSVREKCGSEIASDQDAAAPNKVVCDKALNRFRNEIAPALERVMQLLPRDSEPVQQSREEAALCLNAIAIHYTWADDFIASEQLHEEALTLAQDTVGAVRIEHGLAQVRGSARRQRVLGALRPISSAPSLSTINGFGFRLYGNSEYDDDTESYVTTHYFVALFIPIIPIGRYRVVHRGSQYRFLGRLPLRRWDRWHLGIAVTGVAAILLSVMLDSRHDSGSSYTPSTSSSYDSTRYVPSVPSSPPESHSRESRMSNLNARIKSGRSRISELEAQLQPVIDELSTLNARKEALASELKSLDQQQNAGIQIDIDDYNTKVDTHNRLLSRQRELTVAYRKAFQLYDKLIEEDKALVAQYNALLR